MKFNTAKCRVIRFSSNPTSPSPLHITLNSEPITKIDYIRDLGVFTEKSVNWKIHIDKTIEKAYRAFIMTNGSSYSRVLFFRKMHVYEACVLSIVTYATQVGSPDIKSIRRFERIQKKALKWIIARPGTTYKENLVRLRVIPVVFLLLVMIHVFSTGL